MCKKLILASQSPRRKQLLEESGLDFGICSEKVEEVYRKELGKEKAIEQIAYDKADAVFRKYPEAIVLGADTMVCFQEHRLGKPKDEEEARSMLHMLSGQTHEVITGVALLSKEKQIVFHATSEVTFYELSEQMIDDYIKSEEWKDKAGAYGIQGLGKLFVRSIHGNYFNIVGLPIAKVYREIRNMQNSIEK